jgi:site-specific DNA-methyltransferase (adenine-specific)
MNELAKIESFRRDLALVETFEELKLIGDAGKSYAAFLKKQKVGKESINNIGMFLIEVEERKGEWLDNQFPHGSPKGESGKLRVNQKETRKMPVSPKDSAKSRRIARAPKEKKNEIIERIKKRGDYVLPESLDKELQSEEKKENFKKKKTEFELPIETKTVHKEIMHGDCVEVLNSMPVIGADLLLTDPPYAMDFKSGWNDWEKIQGDKRSETIELLHKSFEAAKAHLKPDAHVYVFGNPNEIENIKPIFCKYFKLKNILIWDRGVIGMGDLKTYGRSFDVIYFGYNETWKDLNGTRDRDILQFNRVNPSDLKHPTEKPLNILEYLIKKSTNENDIVLDIFAGSGTVLAAAASLNRVSYGIEINKNYINE